MLERCHSTIEQRCCLFFFSLRLLHEFHIFFNYSVIYHRCLSAVRVHWPRNKFAKFLKVKQSRRREREKEKMGRSIASKYCQFYVPLLKRIMIEAISFLTIVVWARSCHTIWISSPVSPCQKFNKTVIWSSFCVKIVKIHVIISIFEIPIQFDSIYIVQCWKIEAFVFKSNFLVKPNNRNKKKTKSSSE